MVLTNYSKFLRCYEMFQDAGNVFLNINKMNFRYPGINRTRNNTCRVLSDLLVKLRAVCGVYSAPVRAPDDGTRFLVAGSAWATASICAQSLRGMATVRVCGLCLRLCWV